MPPAKAGGIRKGSMRQQAGADGVADEGGSAAEAELFHEAAFVALDRLDREAEAVGDLLVGVAEGDQAEDLDLALAEVRGLGPEGWAAGGVAAEQVADQDAGQ